MTPLVVNFSTHKLGDDQRHEVAALLDQDRVEVVEVGCQIDWQADLTDQGVTTVDRAGLSSDQWQTTRIVVMVPDLAPAAAVVLADIHGRAGHFPELLWRRPQSGVFVVGGVADLDGVRAAARSRR